MSESSLFCSKLRVMEAFVVLSLLFFFSGGKPRDSTLNHCPLVATFITISKRRVFLPLYLLSNILLLFSFYFLPFPNSAKNAIKFLFKQDEQLSASHFIQITLCIRQHFPRTTSSHRIIVYSFPPDPSSFFTLFVFFDSLNFSFMRNFPFFLSVSLHFLAEILTRPFHKFL